MGLIKLYYIYQLNSFFILSAGLRSMKTGDKKAAQQMMRGRVVAQAFTVIVMGIGAIIATNQPKIGSDSEKDGSK